MRFSLEWLNELVPVDVDIDKLRHLLDMSGTKVERIMTPGADIEGVAVAEVLNIVDHPNADTLTLVGVRTADGEQRVVCGARNFSVGDKVPLAGVGARIPGLKITERKIRGEVSRGMLCSGAELGVSKDHSGILVLHPDVEVGEDVVPILGLDDTIVELEVTPNRGDCMGMIGIAREVAALLGHDLVVPDAAIEGDASVEVPVEVRIDDPEGCPRYVARYAEGVAVGPSPAWVARRLMAAGIRPINNVVDVTNYVMLETGQPLHAFDARQIRGELIVVRRARSGEQMKTLDGVARTLDPDDLLIADGEGPLALAGVMGGEDSEVQEDTVAVVLESAHFNAARVSRMMRRHLLRTEASARFERTVDPEGAPRAAARACRLWSEIAGTTVAAAVVDEYPAPWAPRSVSLRPERTDAVLGFSVPSEEQVRHLESVGFRVTPGEGEQSVEIPSFRPDVEREVDLIEEVARLAGFDRLPATIPAGPAGGLSHDQLFERTVRRSLAGAGLYESWSPSLISERDLDLLDLPEDHTARNAVVLSNPMSEEEAILRTTLLPGLLKSAARNAAHRVRGVALFELARVYEPSRDELPREALVLGAVFAGDRGEPHWGSELRSWDFFAAKGVLEALFDALRLPEASFAPVSGPPFHPTRAAAVTVGETSFGIVGEIHPSVCASIGVPEGTVVLEGGMESLLAERPGKVAVEELPRFPANYLDLAVVVDDGVAARKVASVIEGAGAPEVVSAVLFDVYRGEQIPDGKKSLAYALELRVPEKTVTDEEALAVRDRIMTALQERTGATIRG